MKKIVFLLVNYNNSKETIEFTNKVLLLEEKDSIDICIVNNSNETEYESLHQEFNSNKAVKIMHSSKNLGYLNGANYALESLNKNEYVYYIVCNTDMDFPEKEFIKNLLDFKKPSKTMIIAPKILKTDDNANQNPYYKKKPSKKKFLIWKFFYKNDVSFYMYMKVNQIRKKFNKGLELNGVIGDEVIYAAHGSFMIIHQSFFYNKGTLKYPMFLYGEELYLANQVEKLQGNVFYKDDLLIMHNEHSTTDDINFSRRRLFINQSIKFLYKNLNY